MKTVLKFSFLIESGRGDTTLGIQGLPRHISLLQPLAALGMSLCGSILNRENQTQDFYSTEAEKVQAAGASTAIGQS